jgi:hypothetical protein
MKFSLRFRPDLFTSERATLTIALDKLVTERVIDGYERGAAWGKWSPEDEYQIKIDGPNACCYARRFEKPLSSKSDRSTRSTSAIWPRRRSFAAMFRAASDTGTHTVERQ